jgi:hypothetical protein
VPRIDRADFWRRSVRCGQLTAGHGREPELRRGETVTAARGDRIRERILRAAREQLREAAGDALATALDALDARVRREASGTRDRRDRQADRMREMIERDRALANAARVERASRPASPAPASAPTPAPAASTEERAGAAAEPPAPAPTPAPASPVATPPAAVVCNEPIRTRSMAKLLASQGYAERALTIYAFLIARDGSDTSLETEAAAVREAALRAADTASSSANPS